MFVKAAAAATLLALANAKCGVPTYVKTKGYGGISGNDIACGKFAKLSLK